MLVSIVIPTYNEKDNITLLLDAITVELASIDGQYEIIVVDDASPDNTATVVEQWIQQHPSITLIRREDKRDLSAALAEGFDRACGEYLLAMDADLQHDPSILLSMLNTARQDALEIVVATRYGASGNTANWHSGRQFLSQCATHVTRRLLGGAVTDPLSGYFLLHKKHWLAVRGQLALSGFKLLLDILTAKPPPRSGEIGYTFTARQHGSSKLGFTATLAFIAALWRLCWLKIWRAPQ